MNVCLKNILKMPIVRQDFVMILVSVLENAYKVFVLKIFLKVFCVKCFVCFEMFVSNQLTTV